MSLLYVCDKCGSRGQDEKYSSDFIEIDLPTPTNQKRFRQKKAHVCRRCYDVLHEIELQVRIDWLAVKTQ